jgi:octaprenyl-diphosphate synthase
MTVVRKASLNDICAPIRDGLEQFQTEMKKELSSSDPLIQAMHEHILKMTGKHLRPILTILTSRLNGKAPKEAAKLGVAVELIHTATLVHDDIIDESEFRRNQPTVHSRWGRDLSIVSGDYLYAKAFMILAGFGDPRISEGFAQCAHIMCEGEMKQIEKRKDFSLAEQEYLKIIHKKTAALFQAACMGGGYLGRLDLGAVEKLGRYGFGLGMAFQIVDDCLDLAGESETLGKKAGLDLQKQDMTLPILYLLESLPADERGALIARWPAAGPEELFKTVRELAQRHHALERAMERAKAYAAEASEALQGLPPSAHLDSLHLLAEHCLERVR